MAQNYNDTIHKMQTPFEMRAGLPKKEPKMLEDWEQNHVYEQMIKNNEGKPRWVLHDGPPYANGNIHMGTALNKDIILRYKNMAGFQAPYVPGYDTHGLPIELKALKSLGDKKSGVSKLELRKICKEFATEHIDVMNSQFKRLGVQGDFANPYLTLRPEFEARQVEIFGEMAKKGYIYKGMKAVYWCPEDRTALAEAEIEYAEDECDSIYVRFKLTDDPNGVLAKHNIPLDKAWIVIWTTTTWTLPANVATCLNPNLEYAFVKIGDAYHIMARELVESTMKGCHIDEYEVLPDTVLGSELELMQYQHPFLDRKGLVILGDHVTLEGGTGCVHTAPGHGVEDFEVCVNHYPQVPVVVPVDDAGRLTAEAGEKFAGLKVWDANKVILEHIKESGHLMGVQHITHQYPHCWRCHHPIIFRATEQWFCSIDAFKEDVYKAIDSVHWQPAWGHDRMAGMVRDRSDWCISRQRVWGVPIPIFYCEDCGADIVTPETIAHVAALFREHGSNVWFDREAADLLPQGFVCPKCGKAHFTKETDIMDVWFDSGSTWAAVAAERPYLKYPADLYLEGGDQYRGWFQSSMLTSIAVNGVAPYKQIATHGWTVDGEGKAMHKSLGNAVSPDEVIKDYGADMLRLWVASADYTQDMRISKDIMKQLSQAYLKIRNTARYMLGNLCDFEPDRDLVPAENLMELDRYALHTFNELAKTARAAYDRYEFHAVYRAVYNFCVVDMSNFYLDIIKDRLYCGAEAERRSAQTALYHILDGMTRLIAPILAFTSDEIWHAMKHAQGVNAESVLFNDMPGDNAAFALDAAAKERWAKLVSLRDAVNKALENARNAGVFKKAQDTDVTLSVSESDAAFLAGVDLASLCIVSKVTVTTGAVEGEKSEDCLIPCTIAVALDESPKCPRCWNHSEHIGADGHHNQLCDRCAAVVGE